MTGTALAVTDPVHVLQARNLAMLAARDAGLAEDVVGRVAIAASELATNLVKYATDGLLVTAVEPSRLDLLSTDHGPGMERVAESMRDGFSTVGTLGVGLGGVQRMADTFDIFSRYGEGTTVLARWTAPIRTPAPTSNPATVAQPPALRYGVAAVPALGETVCGDGWGVASSGDVTTVVLSDGLGHGPDAAAASAAATAHVLADPTASPIDLIAAMDADMTPRRGATVAVAQFHPARSTLLFCGIGNTTVRLFSEDGRHETLVSVPGIVGRRQRRGMRPPPLTRSWSAGSRLVMHTDGISDRWEALEWTGVWEHDPATVAGWLLGQHRRHRDDACALVVTGGGPA